LPRVGRSLRSIPFCPQRSTGVSVVKIEALFPPSLAQANERSGPTNKCLSVCEDSSNSRLCERGKSRSKKRMASRGGMAGCRGAGVKYDRSQTQDLLWGVPTASRSNARAARLSAVSIYSLLYQTWTAQFPRNVREPCFVCPGLHLLRTS